MANKDLPGVKKGSYVRWTGHGDGKVYRVIGVEKNRLGVATPAAYDDALTKKKKVGGPVRVPGAFFLSKNYVTPVTSEEYLAEQARDDEDESEVTPDEPTVGELAKAKPVDKV